MLPSLFEWDNYTECIQNGNEYCKVQGILKIPVSNTSLHNLFEERKNNENFLDPSLVYRAICVDKQEVDERNISKIQYLYNEINKKLEMYHVSSEIESYYCTDGKAHVNDYDIIILIGTILYILMVLYATCFTDKTSTSGLKHFSLYNSFAKKMDISKIKLPHLNSFRFISLLIVIFIHMTLQWLGIYVENPEFLAETYMTPPYLVHFRKFFSVVVLSFFLISSWLATERIHRIFRDHGEFSVKHIGIILINRYFRYTAAPIFVILTISNWKYLLSGPVNFDFLLQSDEVCRKYWWSSVLCLSNFFSIEQLCNMHTWFISADFQIYVIIALTHYVIFRKKLNIIRTHCIILVVFCCLHGCLLYTYNVGTGFTPTMRSMFSYNLNKSLSFSIGYISTFANVSSSFIGVILGSVRFIYGDVKFSPSRRLILLWKTSVIVLPILALQLSIAEGRGWIEAVLGSICRPMITLGAGLFLLGISFNLGGILKRMMRIRYLVILGNFCFPIYVTHFIICRFAYTSVPPRISNVIIVMDYFKTLAISIIVGIIFGLIVEEPFGSLQTSVLPQLGKSYKVK
ncbi:O-acyltransferase like protein-like isoform X1 [Diorhabda carinulata]|uniref:O-acyltransferase like protein-like isoform X1 n=1 Tax=Diorhabda carinulata TaxID=1163345 RepID=UPI0025A0245C|nr:O-acyltransferase like protein-like isoform X1 [Diorhabda carinulata]